MLYTLLQTIDPAAYANPNGWTVLLAIVGIIGPILATVTTYLLTKRDTQQIKEETVKQTPKLDTIHVLVNGRMTAALDRVASLETEVASLKSKVPDGSQ